MLTKIRSVLAGLTPEPPSDPPAPSPAEDTIAAQVSKKQKELAQGKTAAQLERLRADLDAARELLDQAATAEGECLVDGRDATAETEAMHRAADRVRALESAIKLAIQKDVEAQTELSQAESALRTAAKEEARERLLALSDDALEIFVRIKLFRADLFRETAAASAVGGIESWGARDIVDYFDFFLKKSNRSPAADAADSGAFRKYPDYATCLLYVCGRIHP